MTTLHEAAQKALEFVTSKLWGTVPYMDSTVYEDASKLEKSLRSALAPQPELSTASKSEQLLASHDHALRAEFQRMKAALAQQGEQPEERIRLTDGEWPIIELGFGKVEVAEGWQGEVPALIFGRNGTGQIGEPTQPDRVHLAGETIAVVTFANVESLDVVAEKLATIRAERFAAAPAVKPDARKVIEQMVEALKKARSFEEGGTALARVALAAGQKLLKELK